MKKINLLVCTLLLTLTIFGCKQNADEMSKYSKAPNVTLPPSKGEDILAGKSFNEPLHHPYTRWEFNDDGTFTEYNTYYDRIRAVYRYTYDAEKKLLSYVPIKSSVQVYSLSTYDEFFKFYRKWFEKSSLIEFYLSEGLYTNEQDVLEGLERESLSKGFDNVDDYLRTYGSSMIESAYYDLFGKRNCRLIEIEDGSLITSSYLPDVSLKELFDKYEIPDSFSITSVTEDKISGYHFAEGIIYYYFSYTYAYDISTKVLKYEKDGEIIEVDLKDRYRHYDF